jgi:glucosyl-3-phosphoglycerate synthase
VSNCAERLGSWSRHRSYGAAQLSLEELLRRKTCSIGAILPARGVGNTLGAILDVLEPLQLIGLLDELLVVAPVGDPAAEIARSKGVRVLDGSESRSLGPLGGKGDALWRGLAATRSEIVLTMDTDTENFGGHFVWDLVGPLITDPSVMFVKGNFHRPLKLGELELETEGGRVTELVARPLLNLFFPELAGFGQPLAGEVAARRELLVRLPFPEGYGVDIAMLIDAWRLAGLDAMAQVDLGVRKDANQTLKELVPMAYAVAAAVLKRAPGVDVSTLGMDLLVPSTEGSLRDIDVDLDERAPLGDGRSS